jgi:hypothetical protein
MRRGGEHAVEAQQPPFHARLLHGRPVGNARLARRRGDGQHARASALHCATEDAVIADHQLYVAGQQRAKKAGASRRELRESRVAQAAANFRD